MAKSKKKEPTPVVEISEWRESELLLRMPLTLKMRLRQEARKREISMNVLVAEILAEKLGVEIDPPERRFPAAASDEY